METRTKFGTCDPGSSEFEPISIEHMTQAKPCCCWYNSSTPGCGAVPEQQA